MYDKTLYMILMFSGSAW